MSDGAQSELFFSLLVTHENGCNPENASPQPSCSLPGAQKSFVLSNLHPTAAFTPLSSCLPLLPPPLPRAGWGSPGIKALLAMVVREWQLPAAGQGRLCAGTLGLLLDPGGGAVESYCRSGRRQSKARGGHRGGKESSRHLLFFEDQPGDSLGLSFQRLMVRHFEGQRGYLHYV